MAKHLTQEQRYYICLQKANFISQKEIAKRIGVSESTISKELSRNSRAVGDYDSDYAGKRAGIRRSKASRAKLFSKITCKMEQYICAKLENSWSPEHARPYHSCDRALNENTNGLIRRYLPKGTNFDIISELEIEQVQDCLNNRPRKSLKYRTPNEVMNKYLQRVESNRAKKFKPSLSFHS